MRHRNNVRRKLRAALRAEGLNPVLVNPVAKPAPLKNFYARIENAWGRIACHERPQVSYSRRRFSVEAEKVSRPESTSPTPPMTYSSAHRASLIAAYLADMAGMIGYPGTYHGGKSLGRRLFMRRTSPPAPSA